MLASLDLQELSFGDLDHDSVTVWSCHLEVFAEDSDQLFDLARKGCMDMLVDSLTVFARLLSIFGHLRRARDEAIIHLV